MEKKQNRISQLEREVSLLLALAIDLSHKVDILKLEKVGLKQMNRDLRTKLEAKLMRISWWFSFKMWVKGFFKKLFYLFK